MLQFLTKFGLYDVNIKCTKGVHISISCEMAGHFA